MFKFSIWSFRRHGSCRCRRLSKRSRVRLVSAKLVCPTRFATESPAHTSVYTVRYGEIAVTHVYDDNSSPVTDKKARATVLAEIIFLHKKKIRFDIDS